VGQQQLVDLGPLLAGNAAPLPQQLADRRPVGVTLAMANWSLTLMPRVLSALPVAPLHEPTGDTTVAVIPPRSTVAPTTSRAAWNWAASPTGTVPRRCRRTLLPRTHVVASGGT
jgi:hypothetical protein